MLTLPTTAAQVYAQVWAPAMLYLPAKMRDMNGAVEGLAIGGQESGYRARVQMGGGPAHSFWQFEEGGGVKGVINHPATKDYARSVCDQLGVPFDRHAIWLAMAENDQLGAAMCRLLLWTDPKPMPTMGDSGPAYDYYVDLWRPGKPDQARWPAAYADALAAVRGAS